MRFVISCYWKVTAMGYQTQRGSEMSDSAWVHRVEHVGSKSSLPLHTHTHPYTICATIHITHRAQNNNLYSKKSCQVGDELDLLSRSADCSSNVTCTSFAMCFTFHCFVHVLMFPVLICGKGFHRRRSLLKLMKCWFRTWNAAIQSSISFQANTN